MDGTNNAVQETVEIKQTPTMETKYCKYCGQVIEKDAVVCVHCGRQVETLTGSEQQPSVVINNSNSSVNTNTNTATAQVGIHPGMLKKEKNKWVALLLCIFLGGFGGHKFYEGKIGMGILYLFTLGLCGIGVIVDFIMLLLKPNPYYV